MMPWGPEPGKAIENNLAVTDGFPRLMTPGRPEAGGPKPCYLEGGACHGPSS